MLLSWLPLEHRLIFDLMPQLASSHQAPREADRLFKVKPLDPQTTLSLFKGSFQVGEWSFVVAGFRSLASSVRFPSHGSWPLEFLRVWASRLAAPCLLGLLYEPGMKQRGFGRSRILSMVWAFLSKG